MSSAGDVRELVVDGADMWAAQLRAKWERWRQGLSGEQLRHKVAMLAGGTALAQVVNVLSMLVLSRIYAPEDFGALTVINSLAGLLSIVATFRLQVAVPLPSGDVEAGDLLRVSLVLGVISSVVLFGVTWWVAEPLFTRLQAPQLVVLWWFLPLTTLGLATYGCLYHWALRLRRYQVLARTRLFQALSNSVTTISVGCLHQGPLGLLIGAVFLQSAGVGTLARDRRFSGKVVAGGLKRTWRKSMETTRSFLGDLAGFPG